MPPKQNKVLLTANQLASLELLIQRKREGFIKCDDKGATDVGDEVANYLADVAVNATVGAVAAGAVGATPAAAVTATVGAVAAATAVATHTIGLSVSREEHLDVAWEMGLRMPLEDLLRLRKMALVKTPPLKAGRSKRAATRTSKAARKRK